MISLSQEGLSFFLSLLDSQVTLSFESSCSEVAGCVALRILPRSGHACSGGLPGSLSRSRPWRLLRSSGLGLELPPLLGPPVQRPESAPGLQAFPQLESGT